MTYRVEQLRGTSWESIPGTETNLGWKAIELCTSYRKFSARYPTRVFEVQTGLVDYFLDADGRRDYANEIHRCIDCNDTHHAQGNAACPMVAPVAPSKPCIDCGSELHATGSVHCRVANQDECND